MVTLDTLMQIYFCSFFIRFAEFLYISFLQIIGSHLYHRYRIHIYAWRVFCKNYVHSVLLNSRKATFYVFMLVRATSL